MYEKLVRIIIFSAVLGTIGCNIDQDKHFAETVELC